MNTSMVWKQRMPQDAEMLDVLAQERQAEMIEVARQVQTRRSIRSILTCLGRGLTQKATVAAMAVQISQWSM